ncbi:Amidase OS=Streptomyces alboniger OX=132473 GN=CP975_32125 PE=3 SV=1 [Streptomyces alboniger]
MPVAVKDDMDVAGEPTAFGCRGEFPPKTEDCEAVRRLRASGAVVVGKTNTCELGQWPFTEGPGFGDTRNPWHTAHTPGGSSGGSAAAVAAGLVPAALGSDGAGSVRIPVAWTDLGGDQAAARPDLDVAVAGRRSTGSPSTARSPGPSRTRHCCSTRRAAATGAICTGRPPCAPPRRRRGSRGRLRIALSLRMPFTGTPKRLHPEVRQRVVALAERLATLGHDVAEADPAYGRIGLAFVPRATAGIAEWARRVPDASLLTAHPRTRRPAGAQLASPPPR